MDELARPADSTTQSAQVTQALESELDRLKRLYLHLLDQLKAKMNVYIGITTAGLGLILLMPPDDLGKLEALLAMIMVVGLITYVGLVNTDIHIMTTIGAIRRIQKYLLKDREEAVALLSYDYWEHPGRFSSLRHTILQGTKGGGEKTMVTAGDSLAFAALCAVIARQLSPGLSVGLLAVALAWCFALSCLLHVAYVRILYRAATHEPEPLALSRS